MAIAPGSAPVATASEMRHLLRCRRQLGRNIGERDIDDGSTVRSYMSVGRLQQWGKVIPWTQVSPKSTVIPLDSG